VQELYSGQIRIWSVGFCGGRKTGEPGETPWSKARINNVNKLNPHMALGQNTKQALLAGGEHSPHCIIPAPLNQSKEDKEI